MSSLTGYNPSSTISTAFSSGNYRHVALSISGTTHTLYLDGSSVAINSNAGDIFSIYNSAIQDLYIGCAGDLSYGYTGTIDDFKIWNRALPIADINNIYFTGLGVDFKGGDYKVTAGEYTYIVFINSGSVVFSKNYNVEYLIIGGGASGWTAYGGGGGAGQCLSGNFIVDAFTSYPVVRGNAGTPAQALVSVGSANRSGNPSSVFGITALGGGRGGGESTPGISGGSGGGGGAYVNPLTAGSSNGPGTNAGGIGKFSFLLTNLGSGGGGGGAGEIGHPPSTTYIPYNPRYTDDISKCFYGGRGGNGTTSHSQWLVDISSVMPTNWKTATSSGYIAGGGGGCTFYRDSALYPLPEYFAIGGLGGGGCGNWDHYGANINPTPVSLGYGVHYTGSGAGGGFYNVSHTGGHGLVVLRFKTAS